MHTKHSLEPIKIYATKQELDEYRNHPGLIRITEMGERREMMEIPTSPNFMI
jgi:hypothetical protein